MTEYREVHTPPETNKISPGLVILAVLLLILGIIIVIGFIYFPSNMERLVVYVGGLGIVIGLLVAAYRFFFVQIKAADFSPVSEIKTSLIKSSRFLKPKTVKDLYVRGEDMWMSARIGKIVGLSFWPRIEPKPKTDSNGEIVYKRVKTGKFKTIKQTVDGKTTETKIEVEDFLYRERLVDDKIVKEKIPEYLPLDRKQGNVVIVVDPHPFPINVIKNELMIILSDPGRLSSLVGDIYVKDVSLTKHGDYFFPSAQYQKFFNEEQINLEGHVAVLTHYKYLDLMSDVTRISLANDPNFQKILLAQSQPMPTTTQTTV